MVVMGYTFRDTQSMVPKLNLPWKEGALPRPHDDMEGVLEDTGGSPGISTREDGSALHRRGEMEQGHTRIRQLRSRDG